MSRIDTLSTDFEGLSQLITQRLANLQSPYYDILIDCTGFRSDSSVPPAILGQFLNKLDDDILQRLHTVFVHAPNSAFVAYFKQLVATVSCEIKYL